MTEPRGIQIGRGYIAVDLDERGAKAALEALKTDLESTLSGLSERHGLAIDSGSSRDDIAATDEAMQHFISTTDAEDEAIRRFHDDLHGTGTEFGRFSGDLKDTDTEIQRVGKSTEDTAKKIDDAEKKIKKADDSSSNFGKTLAGLMTGMAGIPAIIGLWTPAFSAASLAVQAATGGAEALIGAAGDLLGVAGLIPAGLATAAVSFGTLALGIHGVSTAIQDAASGSTNLASDLKNLSPNAQDFVKQIATMQDGFKNLRLDVQNALFAGLADTVKNLGTTYLPILHDGLVAIASALNTGVKAFTDFLKSPQGIADTSRILVDIKETIASLTPGLVGMAKAFTTITEVGAEFLPGLADHLTDLANRFNTFIEHARESGQLAQWISTGITAFSDLAGVVANVGRILVDLFTAGQDAGLHFLGTLKDVTGEIDTFLRSAQGKTDIQNTLFAAQGAMELLVPLLKDAVTAIAGLLPMLERIGAVLAPSVDALVRALGTGLRNLEPGLTSTAHGLTSVLDVITRLIAPVAQIVNALGGQLGGALSIVSMALGSVVPYVRALADVLSYLTDHTGALIPILASAIAGFVAFRSVVKLVSSDGSLGKWLADAASKLEDLGTKAGGMATKVTGSAAAGEKLASAGSAAGKALTAVGSAIPYVGVALVGLGYLLDQNAQHAQQLQQSADDMAKALVSGGQAGEQAAHQLADLQRQMADAQKALNDALKAGSDVGSGASEYGASVGAQQAQSSFDQLRAKVDAANKAYADLKAQLGPVGIAQAQVTEAQTEYNSAVEQFGATSPQAAQAEDRLKAATQQETDAQWEAQRATQSHDQALQALQNQALGALNAQANLKTSELDLKDAETNLAAATKQSGASSEDAQRSEANYEQALGRTVQAVIEKSNADNASLPPSQQVALANQAVVNELNDLIKAAGSNAPPALLQLRDKMQQAATSAATAQGNTNNLTGAINGLPPGKDIPITESGDAWNKTAALQGQLNQLTSHPWTFVMQGVITGATPSAATSLPGLLGVGGHQSGGAMAEHTPYVVGERGPELVIPDRGSYVLPAADTRTVLSAAAKRLDVRQYNMFSPGLSEQQVADIAANSLAWRLRGAR